MQILKNALIAIIVIYAFLYVSNEDYKAETQGAHHAK